MDAPIAESSEQYRVDVAGSTGSLEIFVGEPTATIAAADLTGIGVGQAAIDVRQLGDFAASHPAQTSISL